MGDPLWYYGDFTRPDHWGHWTMFFKGDPEAARREQDGSRRRQRLGDDAVQRRRRSLPHSAGRDQSAEFFARLAKPVRAVLRQALESLHQRQRSRGAALGLRSRPVVACDRRLVLQLAARLVAEQIARSCRHSAEPQRRVGPIRAGPANVLRGRLSAGEVRQQSARRPLVPPTGHAIPARSQRKHLHGEGACPVGGERSARPVGVCVGRGGRVFVTICYMAQNEGSPVYRSDLVVITRKDDPDTMPFDGYDATKANVSRLHDEFKSNHSARSVAARQELLRRGEELPKRKDDQKAIFSSPSFRAGFVAGFAEGLQERDPNAARKMEAEELGRLVAEGSTHIAQRECLEYSARDDLKLHQMLCRSKQVSQRLAGVLTVGFRLTIPPLDAKLPDDARSRAAEGGSKRHPLCRRERADRLAQIRPRRQLHGGRALKRAQAHRRAGATLRAAGRAAWR